MFFLFFFLNGKIWQCIHATQVKLTLFQTRWFRPGGVSLLSHAGWRRCREGAFLKGQKFGVGDGDGETPAL